MRAAARGVAGESQSRVYGLRDDAEPLYTGAESGGYILGVPLRAGPGDRTGVGPVNVITLMLEQRSKQAVQTTSALVEVLAGYLNAHVVRQQLRRTRAASAAIDLAARLIASVNNAPNFKGATIQLTNDLMRQLAVDRVALGWVRGPAGRRGAAEGAEGVVRVVGLSDTEHIDRRMAMVQRLESAMDECLDQQQPVLYPPPSGEQADPSLTHAIVHAHRELASTDVNLKIASVPIRVEERVVGVLTIESASEGEIDPATIELLQATMDLIGPVLELRRSDDRPMAVRTWDGALKASAWLVGPRHTAWKLVGLLAFVALLVVTFVQVPYRIEADFTLEPEIRRVVSVPFDGKIFDLGEGVEPGAIVESGQVLATLDTSELELQALEAASEIRQAQTEADAYLRSGEISQQKQAEARVARAQAALDRLEQRIEKATLRAPMDGTIVAGDLRDRVGAAVALGDALFEIAPLDDLMLLARVEDRDIAYVADSMNGSFAPRSDPDRHVEFVVTRIVPMARAEEGQNIFEVRAQIEGDASGLLPGMEGIAKFDTGEKSIGWILSRRIRDTLRLWLWW